MTRTVTLRRVRARGMLALAASLLLAGCLDFAEPQIPNRASPAILQANIRAFDNGTLQVDGSLQPGRDSVGFQRVVQSPFILVNDNVVEPRTLGERGVRTYSQAFPIARGATAGPFELVAPDVRDAGTLPVARLVGIRRVGSDTIVVRPGDDVLLRMDSLPVASQPPNRSQQWFLDIRSGARVFRISSDGPPPSTLRIPSDFVPPSPDGRAFVGLIYFQTASLRSDTGNYLANVVLDVRLNWIVVFDTVP